MFEPREGDLAVSELMARGNEWAAKGAEVYFKFTCAHCGERCTFEEANTIYEEGECCVCGKKTPVKFGGFSLVFTNPGKEAIDAITGRE